MHADKEARPNAEQIGKDREPAKRTSAESLGWSAAEPQEQGRREHSHPAERTTAYSSHLTFCNRNRGGPFGVRRQSEAATALYIKNRRAGPLVFGPSCASVLTERVFLPAIAPNRNVLRIALISHRSSFQRTAI